MVKNIKIIILLNILMSVTTIAYSYIIADKIPKIVAIHFNILGIPDLYSDNSTITLYTIPMLVSIISILIIFVYYHPEYSFMPFSMVLLLIRHEIKEEIYMIVKKYMIKILTLVNTIFVYLYFSIISVWLGVIDKLNVYVIASLTLGVIILSIMFVHQMKIITHHNTYDNEHKNTNHKKRLDK